MMRTLFFTACLLCFLTAPAVAMTVTILTPTEDMVIERTDPITLRVRITDWNTTNTELYYMVYDPLDVSPFATVIYAASTISLTGNCTVNITISSEDLPFDSFNYTFIVGVPFIGPYTTSNFSIEQKGREWKHMVSLQHLDPYCYDLKGARVMRDGFTWEATTFNTTETIYVFLVDGARRLISYGTRTVSYQNNGTIQWGDVIDKGFTWHKYRTKTSYDNRTFYDPREDYYMYIGCKVDASHTWENMRITMLDNTGMGYDFREINWSIDDYTWHQTLTHGNHDDAIDFQGYFSYFLTFPGKGESFAIGNQGEWNFMQTIRDYSDDVGMPWLPLLAGFILVIAMVGLVWKYARKYRISIPNFVYILVIAAGVAFSWVIGFFDTWQFVFFIVTITFSLTYMYRESIADIFLDRKGEEKTSEKLMKRIRGSNGGIKNG